MIQVSVTPNGGQFIEFVRIDIIAADDGVVPITTAPYEVFYTTDGTLPEVDLFDEPLGTTKKRKSPAKGIPISKPTTLKFFARTLDGSFSTETFNVYFDLTELTALNEIHTAPATVRNYTVAVANGDILKTDNGLYAIVFAAFKTAQDIREIILVENVPANAPPGNRTLPQFGSALNRLLGKSLPAGFVKGQIQTTILEALTFLSELQREENVPADEQIDRILFINVDALSPTSYRYDFSVQTVSGQKFSDTGLVGG